MGISMQDFLDAILREQYMVEQNLRREMFGYDEPEFVRPRINSEYFNDNTIIGEVVEDERDTEPDTEFRIDDAIHTHIRRRYITGRYSGHWDGRTRTFYPNPDYRRWDADSDFLGRPYAGSPIGNNFGPRPIEVQQIREALSRIGAYTQGRRLPQGRGNS